MKRFKEDQNEEEASKILVYHPPFRLKTLHKTRFGITKESLTQQRIKKTKACIWELDTLDISMKNKTLKILTKEMKSAKGIRKLSLNSRYHHDITNLGLSYLGNSLKSLLTMKEITLDFYYYNGISNQGISHLCKGLKRLRFLKKSHLDFSTWCPIYSVGFSIVRASLKTLRYLQAVCFDFGSNFQKDGVSLLVKKNQGPNRIIEGLKRCQYLRNIQLIIYRDYLNDVPFEIFSRALGRLVSLRRISVELEESSIKDDGFLSLCKEVGRFGWIKIIHVNLCGCQEVSDEGIEAAKEYLNELSSREEVVISKEPERKIEEERLKFI